MKLLRGLCKKIYSRSRVLLWANNEAQISAAIAALLENHFA